jgi:hypothetical protein
VQVEEIETLRRERVALLRVEIGSGGLGLHKIAVESLLADVEFVSLLADVEFVFNVPCRV